MSGASLLFEDGCKFIINNMRVMKFLMEAQEIRGQCLEGETLLSLALRLKLPLHHSCGGMGTCGTCRVVVREGLEQLPSPGEVEQEMIQDRGFSKIERLACQLEPIEGLIVEIPTSSF